MATKGRTKKKTEEIAVAENETLDLDLDLGEDDGWSTAVDDDDVPLWDAADEAEEEGEPAAFDVEAELNAMAEATTPVAEDEDDPRAAAPAPASKEVKIVNGISSTLYNRMRKETKETPHRLAIDATVKFIKPKIDSGEVTSITNDVIDKQIHAMWGDVDADSDLWAHTTYVWYNHVSDRAKMRLYNAVRSQLVS